MNYFAFCAILNRQVAVSLDNIMEIKRKRSLTSWQFIAIGYLIVILIGSFLLALPFSSKEGSWTSFISALFTSVSATCVTGLSVVDTSIHWSTFGQIVILLLIQIGGIGFMTIITLFALLIRRQIGIYERRILMQSSGSMRSTGIIRLIRRILLWTAIFEGCGFILLSIQFCKDFGILNGLYYALFHSVSAFCNAGFDLMGGMFGQDCSLIPYAGNALVNLTIMALIFMGGIGFIVWDELLDLKFNLKKLSLHSKIVLITSSLLVVLGALIFWLTERNGALSGMSPGKSLLISLFQSVTTRTAGFKTVDIASLTDSTKLIISSLMFIGGSSGSTAGGIKTTTFVILIFGIAASARGTNDIRIGKRRLDLALLSQACTIITTYLLAVIITSATICAIEPYSLSDILLETVSAIATCGLSVGITGELHTISLVLLMLLMYIGRVGIITLALAFFEKRANPPIQRPLEKILIG